MKPIGLFAGLLLPAILFCSLPSLFSPTATRCPEATPEPLWVDPIPATTDQDSILVQVYIGRGEAITISTESGVFAVQGTFSAFTPAQVPVDLLPGVTHHLEVSAAVERSGQGGCEYGGYTLHTSSDRNGAPLVIAQVAGTPCPQGTQSPFWVDPLPTATDVNPIFVTVHHGLPGTVTITTESGAFTGELSSSGSVQIEVPLQPGENHLSVTIDVPLVGPANCSVGGYTMSTDVDSQGAPLVAVHAEASTGGPTPTLCPQPTPEPLWVEPIPATTDQASIIVQVILGNGEKVEIETESGTFTAVGEFNTVTPALVEVTLLPGTTHHLKVTGYVARRTGLNGCTYGGYSLSTTLDRDGGPLVITRP